jgi:hypothetical protein
VFWGRARPTCRREPRVAASSLDSALGARAEQTMRTQSHQSTRAGTCPHGGSHGTRIVDREAFALPILQSEFAGSRRCSSAGLLLIKCSAAVRSICLAVGTSLKLPTLRRMKLVLFRSFCSLSSGCLLAGSLSIAIAVTGCVSSESPGDPAASGMGGARRGGSMTMRCFVPSRNHRAASRGSSGLRK